MKENLSLPIICSVIGLASFALLWYWYDLHLALIVFLLPWAFSLELEYNLGNCLKRIIRKEEENLF